MRIALFQPDIPQNLGATLRIGAGFGVPIDVIEPCGFVFDDRRLRRAGMDYAELAVMTRHASWDRYLADRPDGRLVLLTTRGAERHCDFAFRSDDALLFGRESAGAPEAVHAAADARVAIALRPPARSLNLAVSVGVALAEALRRTDGLPPLGTSFS